MEFSDNVGSSTRVEVMVLNQPTGSEKGANMGGYRPSFQQIAFVDTETGERKEERLAHCEAAEEFYRALA